MARHRMRACNVSGKWRDAVRVIESACARGTHGRMDAQSAFTEKLSANVGSSGARDSSASG